MTNKINSENTYLGIEFGSTRIKAVLIDDSFSPIASGSYEWANKYENGFWTYSTDEVIGGLKACYAELADNVKKEYGVILKKFGAIGISGMMHGFMAFDKDNKLLTPFRTWRNTTTKPAADELTEFLNYNIPQRWSVSHLYQAIKNNEPYINNISHMTTLSGYVHFLLTGVYATGVDDASGMFPVNGMEYDKEMLGKFSGLISKFNYSWNISDVLPKIYDAGEISGVLTQEGAALLDPTGNLESGISLCPPEGDAGTGMIATNSIVPKTGNVSAGTSVFSMLVLEKRLDGVYPEIDIVSTPDGKPTAMVHCNNCCSELDAWVLMFCEFAKLVKSDISKSEVYELLYKNALNGEPDGGGIVSYNFISGEPVAGVSDGVPMYFRKRDSVFNLANIFRAHIYSAFSTLKIGMDILFEKENVNANRFLAHGGLFKVSGVAQQLLADAFNVSVSVMPTAGEGGAWGMALLAAFTAYKKEKSLSEFLDEYVFKDASVSTLSPDANGAMGFMRYLNSYKAGLDAQNSAAEIF